MGNKGATGFGVYGEEEAVLAKEPPEEKVDIAIISTVAVAEVCLNSLGFA